MKQTAKKILGASVILLACSGIAATCGPQGETLKQAAPAAPAIAGLPDLTQAAESSVNGVVSVRVTINGRTQMVEMQDPFSGFPDFFGDIFGFGQGRGNGGTQRRQVETPKRQAMGSGVIISNDGYIVTNNHVVQNADEVEVKLNDNREFKARVIGTDPSTDLALLKVSAKNLSALPIGNSDDLKLGEWVLAVGNPYNLTSTVTAGIVSAKARSLGANGVESFIQTDAAINQGNSGGALVNTRGELVGINAMLVSQTGSNIGYGFAIPTTIMNKVVADLKAYGKVQRALLNIQGTDVTNYIDGEKAQGKEVDLGTNDGIYVSKVLEEGTAADAGLKEGDVITAIDGKKVSKMAELQEAMAAKRPGEKMSITYLRSKKKNTVSVTLKNEKGNTKVVKDSDIDALGAAFRPISDKQKQQLDLSNGLEVVTLSNGKMADAGVPKGFIIVKANNRAIKSVDDLEEVVAEANKRDDQTLWIIGVTAAGKDRRFGVYLGN